MTVSATGLSDIYKTEDGWGNTVGSNGPDDTNTGTVTATESWTGTLEDVSGALLGIELDKPDLEIEGLQEEDLTAKLVWKDNKVPEGVDESKLLRQLKWHSSNNKVVALRGDFRDKPRNVIRLVPKAGGKVTVTVTLDNSALDIHYSSSASVTVLTYAGKLQFNMDKIKEDAFTNNSLVLDEYVDRFLNENDTKPTTTSDVLTFAIKDPNKCTTFKNGVLTLKKKGTVEVKAVGRNVDSGEYTKIEIQGGNHAKKITFPNNNKLNWKINDDGLTYDIEATVEKKNDGDVAWCTDQLTWSSNKPAIVDIDSADPKFSKDNDKAKVTLVAKSAGKAVITVKASSGKSGKLAVTVSADLTAIRIELGDITKLYSGQTVDLYSLADQYFGPTNDPYQYKNFTDAGLKWSFSDSDSKKLAKLNAKGVLTVNPDIITKANLPTTKEVKFKVTPKKGTSPSAEKTLGITQIDLKSFSITQGRTIESVDITNGKALPSKGANEEVAVNGTRIYKLMATAVNEEDNSEIRSGSLLGWTASNAGKVVKSSRAAGEDGLVKQYIRGIKKGTSKITITGSAKKGNKYVAVKYTFNEKVIVPTKTLTLSVKNKAIPAIDGKVQTIAITPKMDKGATTNKNKNIEWTYRYSDEGVDKAQSFSNGKLKLTVGTDKIGKKIIVTARTTDGYVQSAITLNVVAQNNKSDLKFEGATNNKIEVSAGKSVDVELKVAGENNGKASVTYTVNKPGAVFVLQPEKNNPYKIRVWGIAKGSAVITAKTADGVQTKLTVKVNN